MAIPVVIILARLATVLTSIKGIISLFKREEVKEMKNWRTTLIGALGAAVTVIIPLLQDGNLKVRDLATAAAIAFLGYFAKDAGVTGTEK